MDRKDTDEHYCYYLARVIDESCDPTLAGGIDDMFLVNLEEVTCTLVLLPFPRLVFNLSFVSNILPNNFTNILYNLKYFHAELKNFFIC
uniref:Uncharacterized protein n=1 Tax=Oryza brachyantha TaxID=4533 RepID=J3N009_ORYBR